MPLKLLEHPDSPNCRKVRLLLAALDVSYTSQRIDLLGGETRTQTFLTLNPAGKIPVLIDGGLVLAESNAILLHLAARFAPAWAGRTEVERAHVNRFLFWSTSGPMKRIATVGYERVIAPRRGRMTNDSVVAAETREWHRDGQVLEHWLREHAFIADALSVADVALGAWIELADDLDMLRQLPATREWMARLRARDFWTRAGGYELIVSAPR